MKSEDNSFNINNIISMKSISNNDLTTNEDLSSREIINSKNTLQVSYDVGGNSPEKENVKFSIIKNELENENDQNINNFLPKDIINSMNEINYKSKKNLNKNKSINEVLFQDKSQSYEDEKILFQTKSKSDNVNIKNSKIEKDIINDFSFNLNTNKSSDFHINNNLNLGEGKNGQINNDNKPLNNNININNENEEINSWNFNVSPSEIFNIDNQKNKQNNNENYKLNDINIHVKSDVNNSIDLNNIFQKNEPFKLNAGYIKINDEGYLHNENQNDYINFGNKNDNKQCQNYYIDKNFLNKDDKNVNNFFEQKDLSLMHLNNNNNKKKSQEDISNNKLNIYRINSDTKLNEIKNEQTNILKNNNFNYNHNGNNIICYNNNYINLINPIYQNKNIKSITNEDIITQSHNTKKNNNIISFRKDKDDLNKDNYIIKMFGRFGWICRICSNFNFETRNICNRCKALKAPKTKEEINENKKGIVKKNNKKIKENKPWFCPNCKNINYYFRKFCNRCQVERKKEFPSFYLEHTQKLNEKNNNKNSMGNRDELFNCSNININNYSNNSFLHYTNANNNFERNYFKSFCINNNINNNNK